MRAHTVDGPANSSTVAKKGYPQDLLQLSQITRKILSKLKSPKNHDRTSKKAAQIIYPDKASYAEIQRLIDRIYNYYSLQETPFNQEKLDELAQTIRLLNLYARGSLSVDAIHHIKKGQNTAFFGKLIQAAVAMFLVSFDLYQFAFISQAAWLAAKIFIINTSFFGMLAVVAYLYLTYIKNEPKINDLLTQLSEKLSPYRDVLCNEVSNESLNQLDPLSKSDLTHNRLGASKDKKSPQNGSGTSYSGKKKTRDAYDKPYQETSSVGEEMSPGRFSLAHRLMINSRKSVGSGTSSDSTFFSSKHKRQLVTTTVTQETTVAYMMGANKHSHIPAQSYGRQSDNDSGSGFSTNPVFPSCGLGYSYNPYSDYPSDRTKSDPTKPESDGSNDDEDSYVRVSGYGYRNT